VPVESLRDHVGASDLIALYVGNLERYQGVGLMLEAVAGLGSDTRVVLVVIGGLPHHISQYLARARALGVHERVRFLGPRPLAALSRYLAQADILLSPRSHGSNTPLKLYSYMKAAKPILATRIRSHTQVLDDSCALLCLPDAVALASGLSALAEDPALCARLGNTAAARVAKDFTLEAFQRKLLGAYRRVPVAPAAATSEPRPSC
jgi:glycosyltransferase involved in cell wall biosynthesis